MDSTSHVGPDLHAPDFVGNPSSSYYQLAKSMLPGPLTGYQSPDNTLSDMSYHGAVSGLEKRPRTDRGLLPPPDLSNGLNRSQPPSVPSSVAGDSPATPALGDIEHFERRRNGKLHAPNNSFAYECGSHIDTVDYYGIPKLDRTMTDVYGDELYNPNFSITSSTPSHAPSLLSFGNDIFNQRLSAANSQHLSGGHSPASTTSRARSPFRAGSPFAPPNGFGGVDMSMSGNGPTQYTQASQQHQRAASQIDSVGEPETPKTISPKDAVLEFNEADGDGLFPLFQQEPCHYELESVNKTLSDTTPDLGYMPQNGPNPAMSEPFGYLPSQLPTGIQVPQQYPFIARTSTSHETPPRLGSSGASSAASGRGDTPSMQGRPSNTGADTGTYTCTYHGCSLRFETPTMLQKHKREGHRQSQALGLPRMHEVADTANVLNTQAGPHRCDRINPSTGKPCNTVFSRPYDLTRHEDTIHNARKQKVYCDLCSEEKSFSRADALTRHYRVCHPEVDLPGKGRRRRAT